MRDQVLEIRRYRPTDHAEVIRLHHLGLDQFDANAGAGPWDDDLADIPSSYLGRGEFLVGKSGGRLVAMGALREVSEEVGEIKRMRVSPEHQRRGYGGLILDALEMRASGLAYRRLILDTTVNQGPAQAFYRKYGYRETRRDLSVTPGLVFFEKEL